MIISKVELKSILLQIVFGWMLCHALAAQQPADHTILTVNDGLSQGMVFDILQSKDGFLWIATKHGLNRYDGNRFEVFNPDAFDPFSLGHGEVRKLFEDSRGWIWVGHIKGLDVYNPKTGHFFHLHKPGLPLFTGREGGTSPFSMIESSDGVIWMTDHHKIWRLELSPDALDSAFKNNNPVPDFSLKFFEIPALPGISPYLARPKNLFLSRHHGILIGSHQGLYQMDLQSNQLRLMAAKELAIIVLGEDDKGTVYFKYLPHGHPSYQSSTSSEVGDYYSHFRLGVWDGNDWKETEIGLKSPGITRFNNDGTAWIVESDYLRLWDIQALLNKGKPFVETQLKESFFNQDILNFLCIHTDKSGIVWIGSSGYGILKVTIPRRNFFSIEEGKTQRTFVQDPDGFFYNLSHPAQGYPDISFQSKQPNPWAPIISSHPSAYPLVFDKQGHGWGLSRNGYLIRIDKDTKQSRQIDIQGYGLLLTENNKLITAQRDGLLEVDPQTQQSKKYPFDGLSVSTEQPALYVHQLYLAADGTIWIFAFEGLIKATPQKNGTYEFEQYKNDPKRATSLSSNKIISVADDPIEPDSFLWLGTKGAGLNRLNKKSGEVQHFSSRHGLPDNVVYGILSDNSGHIWLSSNKGLTRFHVRKETVKNFTVEDGLQHNEFNTGSYFKTKEGRLLFGGINGFTYFLPDSIRFNSIPPNVHIVRIKIGNDDHLNTASMDLKLPPSQNFLRFEIASLDFTAPIQNRYKYRLIRHRPFIKHQDKSWVDLYFDNKVQFANLPPGRYTFQALGSNNDGIWNPEPASITFVISAPWWATWWAFLFYTLAGLVLIAGMYRYQFRRKVEQQEALRLKELDGFKNRFFTNITHEFRTPLTVILGVTDQLGKNALPESSSDNSNFDRSSHSKFSHRVKLIRRSGENLLRLINQILDLAKLEKDTLTMNYIQGDVVSYLRYIIESLSSFAASRNVQLKMENNKDQIVMDYEPDRLLQIVYNLISNAIKFSPDGGLVVLKVKLQDEDMKFGKWLRIEVEDNGTGISGKDLPFVFDRFYQAQNSEHRKLGGTGIGLALSKELANMMNGGISVESEIERWTKFTLTLPVLQNAWFKENVSGPELSKTEPIPGDRDLQSVFSGSGGFADKDLPLLLIIEDNPDVVEYLISALDEHYALILAFNGKEGIEKALEYIPDLLISDVMMPEKDGFEVVETLKNIEHSSHIPMVLLTAKAEIENRILGLKKGADAYLSKPFNQEELLATLTNLLETRRKLQIKFGKIDLNVPKPELANSDEDPENAFVLKVKTIILDQIANSSFTAEELSRSLAMSRPQLHRKLTALTGKNISQYIRSLRLAKANEMLKLQNVKVSEVAYAVGFDDPKYFSRVFTEEFGIAPSKL